MRQTASRHPTPFAVLFALALAPIAGCAGDGGAGQEPAPVDITTPAFEMLAADAVELVDLSYGLSPDSIYWPTGAPFEHEFSGGISEGGYWYASGSFSSPEHLGTHLDAPIHFGEGQWTSAEIPLRRLFGSGAVIDISARTGGDSDTTLQVDDIASWEAENGTLAADSIVIVRTGWAARWPDWNAYYGTETPTDISTLRFPGVSPQAAELLVQRRVAGVGIDTASIDPGNSTDFRAHQVLAAANIFNLENLSNIEDLPATGFGIIALPMKIENGTGGPARVVAVVPR